MGAYSDCMEKSNTDPKNDIAKEPFKGTGPVIASAGYMYISHLGATVSGILIAGFAAYHAHVPIHKWIVNTRNYAAKTGGIRENIIKSLFGAKPGSHPLNNALQQAHGFSSAQREQILELVAEEEHGIFESMATKVAGWFSKNKQANNFLAKQSEEQLATAFIGGGLGGAAGWIGSTAWASFKGGKEGIQGKQQFERAKAEIENLRETNDNLNKINDKLHEKVVEISTKFKDRDASDASAETTEKSQATDSKPLAEANETKTADAEQKPTPAITNLSDTEHQGKLATTHAAQTEIT